jgi:hypothetical protein
MTFGVVAARALVPDVDVLADGIADSLAELAAAASSPSARAPKSGARVTNP